MENVWPSIYKSPREDLALRRLHLGVQGLVRSKTSSREMVIEADTRRGDQRESMLLRQSRRSRRFRSNSYDCGDPKESTVPTRVAQSSRPSLSVGESREAPFDSQEEPQPRVRTKQSSLPPKTSDLAGPTSEQDWR